MKAQTEPGRIADDEAKQQRGDAKD